MAFRTHLVVSRGCTLSRVNAIVQVASQCLVERERQTGVSNPCRDLRRLPVKRAVVQPFSLPELRRIVEVAPPHLADYVLIRGLTGMRSGEANGLRWDCVDLEAGTIEIRRARAVGQDRLPKNEFSERLIPVGSTVVDALRRQLERTGSTDGYVFQTRRGAALDIQNFARRDWRGMLMAANLTYRCPEQLRHTAATLMLAAGEAPTFVAQILGHADCRMLLTTYARFMPHALGRQDGLALEAIIGACTSTA
jgi:Site-specific recombinase XerD